MPSTLTSQAEKLWNLVEAARGATKYWVRVLRFHGREYPWSLHECAVMTRDGLRDLGHTAYFTEERPDPNVGWPTPEDRARMGEERQIIIGGNIGTYPDLASIPDNSIVYNFEQAGSPQFSPHYLALLKRCIVWEYHCDNIKYLRSLYGINAILVPFGYTAALTPELEPVELDYDVGFVGSMSPQRKFIINELELLKLKVYSSQGAYGLDRDKMLQRCKVVLNMHYYPRVKVMEVVRIGTAMAMHKAVVTQIDDDTRVDPYYLPAVAAAKYKDLAATVKRVAQDPAEREMLEEKGFELFTARKATDSLRKALEHEPAPTRSLPQGFDRAPNPSGIVYRRIPRDGKVR